MPDEGPSSVWEHISDNKESFLKSWLAALEGSDIFRSDTLSASEQEQQAQRFLDIFVQVARRGGPFNSLDWEPVRDALTSISDRRARAGFTPQENAYFIFSLKRPVFDVIRAIATDLSGAVEMAESSTETLDRLGLYTAEIAQRRQDAVIERQNTEILELSTPVVRLWDNILALPLIGTLDSARTQVVMENLLEEIAGSGSTIAIIDITGVPTVDTLVAQHLLKTVAAARLMGADCIISGIRPQIAQTIVHLGVNLEGVITKSSLADAFRIALERTNLTVVPTPAKS